MTGNALPYMILAAQARAGGSASGPVRPRPPRRPPGPVRRRAPALAALATAFVLGGAAYGLAFDSGDEPGSASDSPAGQLHPLR